MAPFPHRMSNLIALFKDQRLHPPLKHMGCRREANRPGPENCHDLFHPVPL